MRRPTHGGRFDYTRAVVTRHPGHDLPIACTLTRDQRAARQTDLLPGLARRARERHPIENGVSLLFDSSRDTLGAIVTAIENERRCCQFFRFQLTLEPGQGPIRVDVTGPPGTSDFLAGLIDRA